MAPFDKRAVHPFQLTNQGGPPTYSIYYHLSNLKLYF